jgi:hypothetical protein
LDQLATAGLRVVDRLVNYRTAVYNNGAYRRPNILFFGDSMIGTATVTLRQMIETSGEISGWGLLPGTASRGGAMLESDACVKWINGETWVLSQSGDYVEFAYNGVGAVEGDLLKIYHLQQSGGGTFKIQSSVDGGAFADEAGYTSISTAGATAGVVNTVTEPSTSSVGASATRNASARLSRLSRTDRRVSTISTTPKTRRGRSLIRSLPTSRQI